MNKKLAYLVLDKIKDGSATEAEYNQFYNWLITDKEANPEAVINYFSEGYSTSAKSPEFDARELIAKIEQRLDRQVPATIIRLPLYKSYKFIAAASLIGLLLLAGLFFLLTKKPPTPVAINTENNRYKNDVLPGKKGAVFSLFNNESMLLDTAREGVVYQLGNTRFKIQNGTILILPSTTTNEGYKLTTQRGRTYHLLLSDGTDISLDAASELKVHPGFVTSGSRNVELTGQAYFTVAEDKKRPFRVKAAGATVEVLGTRFNINTNDPNKGIVTTLISGRIAFYYDKKNQILRPGEEVAVSPTGNVKKLDQSNIEEVVSWKEGYFDFKNSSIEVIMEELKKWYDIEVVYKEKINDLFVAKISRNVPLSKILKLLELTKQVRFIIEGKKVTVMN